MKTEKTINLTAYTVEYIDPREPKPRTVRTETVVLDGGKISALHRLDMNPGGYITQRFERSTGYTVTAVRKGESLTACIDLAELWQQTAAQNELAAVKAQRRRYGAAEQRRRGEAVMTTLEEIQMEARSLTAENAQAVLAYIHELKTRRAVQEAGA